MKTMGTSGAVPNGTRLMSIQLSSWPRAQTQQWPSWSPDRSAPALSMGPVCPIWRQALCRWALQGGLGGMRLADIAKFAANNLPRVMYYLLPV